MKNKKSTALLILVSATVINVLNGVLYTWSAISSKIVSEWGWTSKEASLPYTIFTVFMVMSMVSFGSVMDKKGPRGLAVLGSLLLGLGFFLSGFTDSPVIMIITIGVVTGIGTGMHTLTTSPTAIKWFPPEKKGFVTGIVVSGAALSSLLYSPLGKYLLDTFGINNTFIILGVELLVLTTIFAIFLKNPDGALSVKKQEESLDIAVTSYDWKHMLKDVYFYKLWFMMAFLSTSGLMIISHIVNIAKVQSGMNIGYVLIVILSIFNLMGRIIGGMISDKIGRINLLKILLVVQGINMALFNSYTRLITMMIGVAIVGFCYGSSFSVFPAAISDKYGPKYYAKNYALIFSSWGLSGVIGPMTAAAIFDATGGYRIAYLIAVVLLVVSAFIAFGIREKKVLKESVLIR